MPPEDSVRLPGQRVVGGSEDRIVVIPPLYDVLELGPTDALGEKPVLLQAGIVKLHHDVLEDVFFRVACNSFGHEKLLQLLVGRGRFPHLSVVEVVGEIDVVVAPASHFAQPPGGMRADVLAAVVHERIVSGDARPYDHGLAQEDLAAAAFPAGDKIAAKLDDVAVKKITRRSRTPVSLPSDFDAVAIVHVFLIQVEFFFSPCLHVSAVVVRWQPLFAGAALHLVGPVGRPVPGAAHVAFVLAVDGTSPSVTVPGPRPEQHFAVDRMWQPVPELLVGHEQMLEHVRPANSQQVDISSVLLRQFDVLLAEPRLFELLFMLSLFEEIIAFFGEQETANEKKRGTPLNRPADRLAAHRCVSCKFERN